MEKEKLFTDFPPVSTEAWKQKIIKDLKGADYHKNLVWKTDEGFEIQPFYREEDLGQIQYLKVFPGDFPYVRGNETKGNRWLIRQDVVVKNINAANAKLLDIHMAGVDSFGIIFPDGHVPDLDELERLLKNIRADIMELNFSCDDPVALLQILDQLAVKYSRNPEEVKGSFDFCPLSRYSTTGKFYVSEEGDFDTMNKLFKTKAPLSNFQLLTVNGTIFKNAGAGIVSELAFTLAMAVDYLTFLTENGHNIDDVAPRIRFHYAVGSDYFMELAKFRAARYLWSKIVNAYGISNADKAKTFLHSSNARWNKTLYDPYVNMLRTTTESMSAILGGVDSLSVLPFNEIFEEPDEFSERIARNQSLILKNESFFDKVNDPASGSYYIENLTARLIEKAWELFLQVDEQGGYLKAFKRGFIQKQLREEADKKNMDIAIRKQILLGTNQYPNISEHLNSTKETGTVQENSQNDIELLTPYRGAEAFEKVRMKTDFYALAHKRPVVWMFTYGNLGMRRARAQFAGNFFGAAGFEIKDNPGFTSLEEGIHAAKEAKPEIVVLCSSDEEYTDTVIPVFEALRENTLVALAGYPKDMAVEFKSKGLQHFVHTKSDMLEELKKYQQLLGIV